MTCWVTRCQSSENIGNTIENRRYLWRTLHDITCGCIRIHQITLRYATLRYVALHQTTVHHFTQHASHHTMSPSGQVNIQKQTDTNSCVICLVSIFVCLTVYLSLLPLTSPVSSPCSSSFSYLSTSLSLHTYTLFSHSLTFSLFLSLSLSTRQ